MNGEIPVLKAREILRILERAGFYRRHQIGSRITYIVKTDIANNSTSNNKTFQQILGYLKQAMS